MKKANRKIFITGALGQIGKSLQKVCGAIYGENNILLSDVVFPERIQAKNYVHCDVTSKKSIEEALQNFKPDWIIHLAAILSASGERNPDLALAINDNGFRNILDAALKHKAMLFSPSTIAAFGPSTPRINTPNQTIMRPETVYGVTKVFMEQLGAYHHKKNGLDFRSIRYPGVLSADPPGGGTTDYIVEMYYQAAKREDKYTCFLSEDSGLPMMHGDDLVVATLKLLEADNSKLTDRVYNIGAFSCTPKEVESILRKHGHNLNVTYKPDFRQAIADSWPFSIDYSLATKDWGYDPKFKKLEDFTTPLIKEIRDKLHIN
jgi:threonine 3-dehydrogenase